MAEQYYITLKKIIEDFELEIIHLSKPAEDVHIVTNEVNRPGIVLTGYTDYFDPLRIQILGWTELGFLQNMSDEEQEEALGKWLSLHPAAAVVTRGLEIPQCMIDACEKHDVPLLKTHQETSPFLAALIAELNRELAPRITRHGVLVEVYGEGVLIVGESGAGKSETAIELVKRGHRLIADDAVEIRRVSNKSLVGTAPDNIRHFIELRGIGIINASRIFGVGAVKLTEKIDLVINMEPWDVNKTYDRMGLENQTTDILGLDIPSLTIPVKPGRNLAVIIEVAAMNSRQKKLGYNAAEDLLSKLGMNDDFKKPEEVKVKPF